MTYNSRFVAQDITRTTNEFIHFIALGMCYFSTVMASELA